MLHRNGRVNEVPKELRKKRNCSFVFLVIAEGWLCLAVIWSVYQPYVMERFGIGNGAASQPYSINLGINIVGQLLAGYLLRRKCSLKKVMYLGTVLSILGLILMAVTPVSMPWMLNVSFGLLLGIGIGIAYNAIYVAVIQWFPEKRGMALGFVATSVGIMGFILTYLVNAWLKNFGYTRATWILAICFGVFSMAGCRFANMAPKDIDTYFEGDSKVEKVHNYTVKEMVRTKEFYLIFTYITVALIAYRMVTPMTITMGMDRGVSNSVCVMIALACTVANTCARFFIPIISEKISRNLMLVILFVVDSTASLLLIFATGWLYAVCVPALAACFGGFIGINPAMSADYFGTENAGQNNSVLSLGSSIVTLIVPFIVSVLEKTDYGYAGMFVMASVPTLLGLCSVIVLFRMKKKNGTDDLSSVQGVAYER